MTRVPELRAYLRAFALGAVALAALAAAPARAITITIADSPLSGDQTICPRDNGTARDTAVIPVNAFTAVAPADAQISRVYVRLLPAGAYAVLERVEVRNAGMGTVYGSVIPTGDAFWINLSTPLPVTTAATAFRLAIVPRQHLDMPPPAVGKLVSIQAQLESAVSVGNTVAGSDTASATITIDNASPANLLWAGITSDASSITLDWLGTPDPYVLVLRREIGPVADVPAEDGAYSPGAFPGGTSQVVFAGTAASYRDPGLTGTRPYYYRVFTRDACGNYSSGTSLGPIYPGGSSEGDLTVNSTKPVVGIINPANGPVTRPFKVQIRVASPDTLPITEVRLYGNSGSGDTLLGTSFGASPAVTRNTNYDGGTVDPASGIFEFTASAAFAQGTWTLRAWASNDAARVAGVYSGGVGVVVSAAKGDGKLLVRDNSSQLCSDCHAAKTHSSAATGAGLGSWYVGCRACHDPHGTTNAKLIAKEITPPSVNGVQAPQPVYYSGSASGTGAKVNAEGTGICQVCHTRTLYYQRGATNQTHGDGADCKTCHAHMEGQAAQCFSCHGDKSRVGVAGADALVKAAPPVAASTDPNAIGAHQAHVNQATYRSAPLACENCHALPNAHNGAPDPLPFTGLASTGTTPIWNPGSSRCDATYCHGASLDGNNRNPSWTLAQTIDCDSCHLSPPGGTHTTSTACAGCHGAGYDLGAITGDAKLTHIDGTLQGDCSGCHGNKNRIPAPGSDALVKYAPPQDHTGATAVTDPQVGAHEKHVNNATSTIATPIACAECHLNFVHGDGVVDMRWGTVATTGGRSPQWNNPAGSYTCQTTYCHAGVPGGSTPSPLWTSTAGTLACNSCHGAPPPLNATTHHPPNTTSPCSACHPAGYASNAVSGAALGTHVDGQVQADTGCTACHGDLSIQNATSADLAAAPGWFNGTAVTGADLSGATTGARVGAHQAHLQSTVFRTVAITCNQCHPIPADKNHADGVGNATGARAAIAWGTLANGTVAGGANTNPNFASGTCSSTYCHGKYAANLNYAGSAVAPTWNQGATGAGCGTCHKAPPTSSAHGSVNATKNCGDCHTGYNCTTGNLAACTVPAGHLDGQYQAATLTCASCHGDKNRIPVASATANDALGTNLVKAAPPSDASGLGTSAQVGAHQQHVNGAATSPALSNAITCSVCHVVPGTTTHTATAVQFSGLATTRGATGASIDASNNCSATYCHGNFPYGSGTAAIGWGTGTLAKLDCTRCHGNSPAHPHPGNLACGDCHPGYTRTGATTGTVVASSHVDGLTTKSTNSCTACHGDLAQAAGVATITTPTLAAPGANAAATSKDTFGGTATTVNSVGAHRSHLFKTNMRATVLACTDCHPMPPSNTDTTHATNAGTGGARAQVTLATGTFAGSTSGTNGLTGGQCSNTYCHGNFPGGNGVSATNWPGTYSATLTQTTMTCTSCHPALPPLNATVPHPQNTVSACSVCHGTGFSSTTVATGTHMNGSVTESRTGCTLCHGDLTATGVANTDGRAAPGYNANSASTRGATAATAPGVGAHQAHLTGTNLRSTVVTCDTCHAVPGTNDRLHATGAGTNGAYATVRFLASTLPTTGGLVPTYTGSNSATTNTAAGSCATNYCHGGKWTTGDAYAGSDNSPLWTNATGAACGTCHKIAPTSSGHDTVTPTTQCSQCHPGGYSCTPATVSTTCTVGVGNANHINGKLDGGESGGGATTDCAGCHSTLVAGMNAGTLHRHQMLAAQPGSAVGSGYPTTATAQRCLQCHVDHNIFRADLNATGTRGANLRTAIGTQPTATAGFTNTDHSGTTGICVSCHSASLTKAAALPDGGATTPAVNGTTYGSSLHNYAVTPTASFKDGTKTNPNCSKCHNEDAASQYQTGGNTNAPHASGQVSLLDPLGSTTASPLEENECYRCHSKNTDTNPGGGPAKTTANRDYYNAVNMSAGSQDIFTTFTSGTLTRRHNVATRSGVHRPVETGAQIGASIHVECADCHSPHGGQAGLHTMGSNLASPALEGAPAVTPTWNATNWQTATAITYAQTTVGATTPEAYVCFRCHSNHNTAINNNPATAAVAPWNSTTYGFTNQALEFAVANKSRHPVLAAANAAGSGTTVLDANQLCTATTCTNTGAKMWTPGQTMTCTDCHNTSAGSPAAQGPHGSAMAFMLAGVNKAWPFTTAGVTTGTYRQTTSDDTSINSDNGLFCRNCHPAMRSTYSNSLHRFATRQHTSGSRNFIACVSCHIRVPHGGKVGRLLRTNANVPARYAATGTSDPGAALDGWTKPATKDTYTSTAGWNANCTTHAQVGTDVW